MPTKNELFTTLLNLLKTNVSDVSGRVYSSYPKTNVVFPLIVISTFKRSQGKVSLSNEPKLDYYITHITIYAKTAKELDALADVVYPLLKSTSLLGKKPTNIEEVDSDLFEELDNKGYHFMEIAVTYVY